MQDVIVSAEDFDEIVELMNASPREPTPKMLEARRRYDELLKQMQERETMKKENEQK
jgi:hypothetical protein